MISVAKLCVLLTAGAVAMAADPAAAADASQNVEPLRMPKRWTATVEASKLNVRGGPGDGYPVIETLEQGAAVTVVSQSGAWIRLDRPEEAWVARAFVNLPKDFMAPLFGEADNAFLDWAAATGHFEEVSVEDDGRLSVILVRPLYDDPDKVEQVARDVACTFRERTEVEGIVSVTVWAPGGPAAGLVQQVKCP